MYPEIENTYKDQKQETLTSSLKRKTTAGKLMWDQLGIKGVLVTFLSYSILAIHFILNYEEYIVIKYELGSGYYHRKHVQCVDL